MQEIYINNKKAAISFKDKDFSQIISTISKSLEKQYRTITHLKINGVDIDGDLFNFDHNNISKIEVTVADNNSYGNELLTHAMSILDQVMSLLDDEILQNDSYSRFFLKKVFDALDVLISIIIKLHKFIDFNQEENRVLLKNMKASEMHLFSIIKAIQHAVKKDDDIIICDLLEHELTDNLKQWKINIIPQLRQKISPVNSSSVKI
jgi:hypothetical protein